MKKISILNTGLGELFSGDALSIMKNELTRDSIDLIFADPPFNIGKSYKSKINDQKPKEEYIAWTREWLTLASGLLKPGGSLFVYNLPKWNIHTAQIVTFSRE